MIINDLDGYYIVFDTKNWNTELDTLSYNQGFCSLLGFGSVLKKKSQYLAEELGIVTLLFVICVYSKIITKS